ncbi:hypothetical protein V6C21_07935 [[Clostridium] cellulosi]
MEAVLSLPINAIALDNEEMEYVDGGDIGSLIVHVGIGELTNRS